MAREFASASTQYLVVENGIISAYPITMAAWFYANDITGQHAIMWLGNKDETDEMFAFWAEGTVAGDPVRAFARWGTGATALFDTTTGYSANTWHHACLVSAATNDHAIYIDGGSKGTDTTVLPAVTATDRTAIGYLADFTPSIPMDGRIGEAAIWDVALTDSEVASLTKYAPPFVRPDALVAYWPLIRDEDQDRVGGFDLTPTNSPTIATHPPIIYPSQPFYTVPVAAVAGGNIPEFMHHYQQQQQAG